MMAADDLTCEELVELITEYIEGALAPSERARFENHLAGCDGCLNYLHQMKLTIETAGAITGEAIPAPVRAELLRAFRTWSSGIS
jgi:anti-sigma factor RsiW